MTPSITVILVTTVIIVVLVMLVIRIVIVVIKFVLRVWAWGLSDSGIRGLSSGFRD